MYDLEARFLLSMCFVLSTWIEKEIAWEKPFAFCCCMTLWCDLRHSFVQVVRQLLFLRHRLAFEKKAIECVAQNSTIRIYTICVYKARLKKVNSYAYTETYVIGRIGEKWSNEREKKTFMEIRTTFGDVQWRIFDTHLLIGSEIEVILFNGHVPIIFHIVSLSHTLNKSAVSSNGLDSIQRQIDLQICWLFANHIREKKNIFILHGLAPIKRGILQWHVEQLKSSKCCHFANPFFHMPIDNPL